MLAFVEGNHGEELCPLAWNQLFSFEVSQFPAAKQAHPAEK